MYRRLATLLLLLNSLALLTPVTAAAQYPVQQRLCDSSIQNCRTQILDLIKAEPAGGSIDVAFWFMEDSRYSTALIAAFNRGVRVRVLFDTQGLVGDDEDGDIIARRQIINDLKAAGIPMRDKTSGGILHWKLMIFGAQNIANFSAANFSSVGYVPIQAYVNYEDEVVSFTTDTGLVSSFKSKYDDVWTTTTGYTNYANVTTLERFHPTVTQDPRLNFPPTQNYATRVVSLLDKETVGIDVDMYRITDAKPADALIRAVTQRHIPVRLYTEQEQYRNPLRLWHSYNVDRMFAAGVQVRDRAHQGLNHQKSVILRGQHTLVFGSSNWTTPSASQQLEHNIFTTESFYFDFFDQQFDRKWNNRGPATETKAFVPLPPDAPVYNAPANGATNQSTAGVTLRWNAGLWAHKYDVYLATSSNFTPADRIAIDVELGPSETATSYRTFKTPALLSGTTYYWKVVSRTMANLEKSGPVSIFVTAGSPPPGSSTLPAGWSSADVGAVGAPGSASFDTASSQFTVSGSGADIWGTADEFRFAFTTLTGDGSIVARVASLSAEAAWTKAGVMMRDTLSAGSAQASMLVSAGKGLAFQRRLSGGGTSTSTAGPSATAPYWVKLSRSGSVVTASVSTDGQNWTTVGSDTFTMGSTIQVGLVVSSHVDGTLSTATFDNVTVGSNAPPPPPSTLPSGWSTSDVGSASPAGSASFDTGTSTFTVAGAGADVWGTADAFRYAYTTLTGDGEIVARVDSVQNVNSWTKAGVMMRDGLSDGAAQASMFVTPGTTKGTAFQRRPTADGTSLSTAGPVVAPPYWVKLARLGGTITAYTSADGSAWTAVGSEAVTMGSNINVGLAVSSHVNGKLATATFTGVTVTQY